MPSPQWFGMRPKRTSPSGVVYSAHARFTRMLSSSPFTPEAGGTWVLS